MIMIAIYLFLYTYIIVFDLIPIKKNNHNKLFAFNLIITCISLLIVILVGLNIKTTNPSNLIEYVVNLFLRR